MSNDINKVYTANITISQAEYENINRLLAGKELTEIERARAQSPHIACNGNVFVETFEDGSQIAYNLCAAGGRYFDDVIWTSADGSTVVSLESTYTLEDIEFSDLAENVEYRVLLKTVKDAPQNIKANYSKAEMLSCLKARLAQYMKAEAMFVGTIPWENGFDWPKYPGQQPGAAENGWYWRGAIAELKNTIDMLEA